MANPFWARLSRLTSSRLWLMVVVVALVGLTACANSTVQAQPQNLTSPQHYGGQYAQGTATGDTQEGAAFARWVLDQDPQRQYITDAVVRNDSSLGIKVQPDVTKAGVQQLLVALTQGMAKTFPGRPLTVTAFYQSGDRLAQSIYDPNTDNIDVQFAQ